MEGDMLKSALTALLAMIIVGLWVIATVQTVRIFYDLATLQVEHDLKLAYSPP
jgi:hypothetical protein